MHVCIAIVLHNIIEPMYAFSYYDYHAHVRDYELRTEYLWPPGNVTKLFLTRSFYSQKCRYSVSNRL